MLRRFALAVLVGLLAPLALPAPSPVAAATAPAIEWAPDLPFGDSVFPSYVVASANMSFMPGPDAFRRVGVPGGAIGIRIRVTPAIRTARMRLEVQLPELADPTTYEFTLPGKVFVKDNEFAYAFPVVPFHYRQLLAIDQPFPTSARFRLFANGRPLGERMATLLVHGIQDCPYATYRSYPQSAQDFGWMFAAYVNENDPAIGTILREALDTGIVHDFTGYQAVGADGRDDEVMRQMMAIWVALARRGVVYSDISKPSVGAPPKPLKMQVFSQRVRFFGEALGSAQANCVDGSVLLASVFRRVGLSALLTLRPTHCYLGVAGGDLQGGYHLETTLIGSHPDETALPADRLAYYRGLLPAEVWQANRRELLSFALATEQGYVNYAEDTPKLMAREPGYTQVSVDAARDKWGVVPLSR